MINTTPIMLPTIIPTNLPTSILLIDSLPLFNESDEEGLGAGEEELFSAEVREDVELDEEGCLHQPFAASNAFTTQSIQTGGLAPVAQVQEEEEAEQVSHRLRVTV